MMTATLDWAAAMAAFAGMSGLCLAMDKHGEKALPRAPSLPWQRGLYWGGWAMLLLSLAMGVVQWGAVFGPVIWTGMLSLVVGCLALVLTYRVRWAPGLGIASLVLTLILAVSAWCVQA